MTFEKSHPPLDGNSLVITTLDRVRDHPFVTHAAWDFVVIDECLSVQACQYSTYSQHSTYSIVHIA